MYYFKRLCCWLIISFCIVFVSLHILCPTQKDYATKAEILNKRWEISLPTESEEVYYENFFIWKGEGTRYRILQYNSNNVEDIFVKLPFEKFLKIDFVQ